MNKTFFLMLFTLATMSLNALAFASDEVTTIRVAGIDYPVYKDSIGTVSNTEGSYICEARIASTTTIRWKSDDIEIVGGSTISFFNNGVPGSFTVGRNQTIQGIPAKKNTEVNLYANGKLSTVYLAQNVKIGEVKYKKGEKVCFWEYGAIDTAILAEDTKIHSVLLAKGTPVLYYENGAISSGTLATDCLVDSIPFQGGTGITFFNNGAIESGVVAKDCDIRGLKVGNGIPVTFYPDGKIDLLILREDVIVDGIEFAKNRYLKFGTGGKPYIGTLAKPQAIEGIPMEASEVEFDVTTGKLVAGMLAQNWKDTNGIEYLAGESIHRSSKGFIDYGRIASEYRNAGIAYPARSLFYFTPEGVLENVYPSKCILINGVLISSNYVMNLFPNGAVNFATPETDTTIDGVCYAGYNSVYFYESGRFKGGTLVSNTTIQGISIACDEMVYYTESGKLLSGELAQDTELKLQGVPIKFPMGSQIVFNDDKSVLAVWQAEAGEYLIAGTKQRIESGSFVIYKDYAKKELEAVGDVRTEYQTMQGQLVFDYERLTFIKWNAATGSTSMMRLSDSDYTYLGRRGKAKAMQWIEFDRYGNLKN